VGSSENPSTYGDSVTFTATINGASGQIKRNGVKSQDVTGTVTWSGNTGCGTTNVTSGNPGTATCTTTSLNAGSDTVTANYSGDANHSAGSGSLVQTVNQASQTITAAVPPGVKTTDSFTVSATGGGSGNALTYTSGGDCTNSGATYTAGTRAGTCTVTINQAGNTNYAAATPYNASVSVVTALVKPVVSFTGAPTSAVGGSTFVVTATYPNTSDVPEEVPTITGNAVCSASAVSGSGTTYQSTITLLKGSGTCTMTAKWAANYYYAAATATQKTTATETVPTVSFTGAPTSAVGGSSFTVTATSNETDADAAVPTITGNTVCSVGSLSNTGPGTYEATVTMLAGSGTCTMTAKWAKTIEYDAATAQQKTTAERTPPTVSFTGAPASASNGSSFTVTASSNETDAFAATPTITAIGACTAGSVTGSNGTYQATITMDKVTGTCTMTAKWLATVEWAAATATQKTTATH
jgi:hypothetical protein